MSDFLAIMQAVSINAGIPPIQSVTTTEPDHIKLAQFVNEAGAEVARRVDWSAMRKSATLIGTGTAGSYALPNDFGHLTPGMSIACGWNPVRGSLTPEEWSAMPSVIGMPRYFFLTNGRVAFYPYPRTTDTLRVSYQSRFWTKGGADQLEADSDEPLPPSDLLQTGAIWRWRRHTGKDYSDQLAEFEAQLADFAQKDGGVRQP